MKGVYYVGGSKDTAVAVFFEYGRAIEYAELSGLYVFRAPTDGDECEPYINFQVSYTCKDDQ